MPLTDHELNAFRRMPPAEKIRLTASLYLQAKAWKRAMLRSQHPDWAPEQIEARVKEPFLRGTG